MNEQTKMCEKAIEVAQKIGLYYLNRHHNNYEVAVTAIKNLDITDIHVNSDGLATVVTKKPGLLIGVKGQNIYALEAFLEQKIRIEESKPSPVDFLVPYPPMDEKDFNDEMDMLYEINREYEPLDDWNCPHSEDYYYDHPDDYYPN